MKRFEIGRKYSMRSVCDHECVWTYTVIDRTEKTVTLSDGKETKRCRISAKTSEYLDAETVFPLGQYSMCPSLSADRTYEEDMAKEEEPAEEETAPVQPAEQAQEAATEPEEAEAQPETTEPEEEINDAVLEALAEIECNLFNAWSDDPRNEHLKSAHGAARKALEEYVKSRHRIAT